MLYLGAKKSLLSSGKTLAQQVAAMFAGGEQGAWYEPSLTNGTLFQDSAGTTPVTAVGQPVGLMLDKSGRGNHATQPTTINRPILQIDGNGRHFLAFNGTNSWMSTPAIDFTATDKMTVIAGVRKLSDAAVGMLVEHGVGGVNARAATLLSAPRNSTATGYSIQIRDAVPNIAEYRSPNIAAPVTSVVTTLADYAKASTQAGVRVNGNNAGATFGSAVTGAFGNWPLYLGARFGGEIPFNGQLYGLLIRGALSSDPQIASAERFMAGKTGVTI